MVDTIELGDVSVDVIKKNIKNIAMRFFNFVIPPVRVLLATCTSLYWTFPNSQIRISKK